MANVGIAPSSQNLEFRRADAAMTKDLRAARYKSQQTAAPLIPPKPTLASFAWLRRAARLATFGNELPRRCSAKGTHMLKSSSLASSPEIEKISLVIRSWVQPEGCLIRLWQRLASREVMYMLRMW